MRGSDIQDFYWPFQGGTSFVDLLCFCSVLCLLCLCARLFICALWSPAGKGLTSWLSFVVSNCEFVTFPLVSWVRCGTWLYRFLIFTPLLTLNNFRFVLCNVAVKASSWVLTRLLKNVVYSCNPMSFTFLTLSTTSGDINIDWFKSSSSPLSSRKGFPNCSNASTNAITSDL